MLILYSGSDSYRLNRATAMFVSAFQQQQNGSANVFHIDASEDDAPERIEHPLKYPSFFNEQRLIVVRNAATAAMSVILKQYKLATIDDVVCVAVQNTKHESCDKKILATLTKSANHTETFEPLSGALLATWVREYCASNARTIESSALTSLLQRTENDSQRIANELEKLCCYAINGVITLGDVIALVPARYEQDEWEMSNAIAAHDKRAALAVLWRRLHQGASEQLLLGSVAAGIRNLTMVKDMQSRGRSSSAIAAATGLHPFVVSKTIRGATAADTDRLRRAHISLAQLDRRAKAGMADATDGLFAVLLSL